MANNKNEQGRKWQLTINNPDQYSMTPEIIKQKVFTFNSLLYFCFSYEIGLETKTKHVHIYLASDVPIRFSTLKKRFPSAHIERTIGTSQENRDYIKKEGKWENDPKTLLFLIPFLSGVRCQKKDRGNEVTWRCFTTM